MKLTTLRLFSPNQQASRDWYQKFFNQMPIEDNLGFCSFKFNDFNLEIIQADEKNPFSVGGCVVYIQVENLNKIVAESQKFGATLYRGPLWVKEIKKTIVQIQDPIGNIIGFESN